MSDIQAGDLVVTIDPGFSCVACKDDGAGDGSLGPVKGTVLTVRAVIHDGFPCPGLWFSDFPKGNGFPYSSCCFRKIDKADESFTETVRACRPIEHETASERLAAWMEQGARHEG